MTPFFLSYTAIAVYFFLFRLRKMHSNFFFPNHLFYPIRTLSCSVSIHHCPLNCISSLLFLSHTPRDRSVKLQSHIAVHSMLSRWVLVAEDSSQSSYDTINAPCSTKAIFQTRNTVSGSVVSIPLSSVDFCWTPGYNQVAGLCRKTDFEQQVNEYKQLAYKSPGLNLPAIKAVSTRSPCHHVLT